MTKRRKDNEDYVWMGDHHFNGKVTGIEGSGGGDGIQSITGDGVDNTDPENPVLSYPSPSDIGAATSAQGAKADTAVQPGDLPAAPTWTTISGKPAFVAEGANAAAARSSIGLGTASTQASGAFATAAQGTKADTALQTETDPTVPAHVKEITLGDISTWSGKQNALSNPSQAEAEAGTATTARSWTAQRDRQAIVAASRLIVSVSANKTLALTDEYTYQRVTDAATITIPTNTSVAFPVGAEIDFFQAGAGAITFSPASGVVINSYEDTLVTDGKGSAATLKKVATNEWDLII